MPAEPHYPFPCLFVRREGGVRVRRERRRRKSRCDAAHVARRSLKPRCDTVHQGCAATASTSPAFVVARSAKHAIMPLQRQLPLHKYLVAPTFDGCTEIFLQSQRGIDARDLFFPRRFLLAPSAQTTWCDSGEMPQAGGFTPSPGLVGVADGLVVNPHPPARVISQLVTSS
jgi:hypothetical protein